MWLPHLATVTTILTLTSALAVRTESTPIQTSIPTTTDTTSSIPTGEFITTEHITIAGQTNAHVTLPGKTVNIAIPTCIQTRIPDSNGYVPPGTCNALYDYYPSFGAAVLFSVLFGVVTVLHIGQAAKYKKFCWVLIMACIWEFVSFVTRAISTKHQQNVGVALTTQILVLLAPLWVNAFDYILLTHLIHCYHPSQNLHKNLPTPLLSLLFISLDILSFIIQLIGGTLAGPTSPDSQIMKGIHIYMGGIGLQQFFIFVFLGVAVIFQREMGKFERLGLLEKGKEGWRSLLWTVYAGLGFITIRIIFRLVEFSGGKDSNNPLPFHESYFYIFDAVPMFFALLIMNIIHPGTQLIGPDSEVPSLKSSVVGCFKRGKAGGSDGGGRGFGRKDGWEQMRGEGGKNGDEVELVGKNAMELPPRYSAGSGSYAEMGGIEEQREPFELGGSRSSRAKIMSLGK